jgi:uncharacterized protein YkwD
MLDLPTAPELSEWLGRLNALDLVLLVFFALSALNGARQGFVRGALNLVAIVATVVLAIRGYGQVAQLLRQWVALPDWALNALAFVGLLVVGRLVLALAFGLLLSGLAALARPLRPLRPLNHLAGVVPGLIQGVLFAAVFLTPLRLFPVLQPIASAIDGSVLASQITQRATTALPQLQGLAQQVADVGLVFPPRILSSEARVAIPPQRELSPDPAAEARMLELLNAERTRAGLRPLIADERVRAVARRHSEDMFRAGYFSHTAPNGEGPAERIRDGGIVFSAAGENLAFAPTVEVAHSGLMASPGHRQNILTPEFSRVGIGVISAGPYGRMFTQNFVG